MQEEQKQTDIIPPEQTDGAATDIEQSPVEKPETDKDKTVFCNKFSSAQELEKAYDNLQREFTKKCQRNSDLTKKLAEVQSKMQDNADERGESRPQEREIEASAMQTVDENLPVYALPDWDEKVKGFMQEYPEAHKYTDSIAGEIAADENLSRDKDCLRKAFLRVLKRNDVPYEQLVEDENFLQKYVYGNDRIRDYFEKRILLDNIQVSPPSVIRSSGLTSVTPPSRPKSIREAGGIVKKMLANRRI